MNPFALAKEMYVLRFMESTGMSRELAETSWNPEMKDCGQFILEARTALFAMDNLRWEHKPRTGSAVIIRDQHGRVLCGRRAKDPYRGYWVIPGGRIEPFESIDTAGIRELKEETGLDIEITGRFSTYELIADIHIILIFSFGKIMGGELSAASDIDELQFLSCADIHALPATALNRRVFEDLADFDQRNQRSSAAKETGRSE